jgi:hypothetical protein
MMTIKQWANAVHRNAVDHGWWEGEETTNHPPSKTTDNAHMKRLIDAAIPKLLMIHSEISEGVEELREKRFNTWYNEDGKPEGLVVELADAVIRIFDLCGALGLDIERAIAEKHEYNKGRPFRHGGKAL